ncbi:Ig-like domain-containing protein [Paenibacillus sp. TAB 01]|uniref:Ig-like domain-containing protein n=1 Tax=Paenibacillus sp. TAB 01 TaxID=3368988 RepID=UPI0037526E72
MGTITGQYTLTDAENDAGTGTGSAQDLSTYKWYLGSVQDGSDKVLINGQTGKTYTIQNDDFGQYLFFEVTPKAAAGLNPGAAVTSPGIKVTKKPVADAQTVQAYADVPVTITLTGSDEDLPVTQLVYTKGAANVQYGTLTPVVGSDNMQWRYTANTESVTDSFTFTVTDSDDNVSAPATVTIKVNKSLDGWVGNSQGITQPVKAAAGQLLKISAVSSVEADEVTAKVDSTVIPAIPLTLVNAGTYITDGFKQWANTGFTIPADTPAASYHVSFTAEKDNISLPDEPVSKLANNDFDVAAAPIANGVEKSADKGQEVSFTQADFTGQFTDSQHNSAGLIKVKISDLPVQGLLLLNNIPVSEGDEIDAANLGQLTFVPEPGQTGTVTFTWNGYDGLQYAAAGNHVTIKINNPPVVGDIQKTGLAGAVIPFAPADFTGAFTDTDPGNTLEKVKISLPGDFASKGKLWYTPVTTAVYVNPGSFAEIDAADLASLKFEPVENLPAETLVSFKWEGQDGRQYSENQGNITITYNGKPIAIPQTVKLNEGTASISIVLKGMDAETVTGLVYGIQSQPSKGSLSPAGGDTWIYTPDPGFTGEDSFSFTVTDGDHQVSLPVNVTIHVIKQLDGWVGDKAQGDPTVIKGMPGQPLKLSAVSSVEADEVVAAVDGTTVPLSLTNGLTYQTDGFKRWEAVEFVLPLTTAPQTYQVTFEAKREGNSLQTEEQTKLGDNRFEVIGVGLNLSANPAKIIGDGKSTTSLTAVLTDKDGKPIAGVEVVFSVPAGAGNGSFPDSDRAVTDAQGKATVLYQSSKITGTAEKKIPVTATVNDPARGLYAQDQIMVTFQPASVSGIITKGGSNEPVPNATVRITLDLNNDGKIEPGVDFDETVQTDADGAYSIIVPKGDVQYELEVTQTVTVGNVQAPVTYKQKAYVGEVTGVGNEDFDSEKTVSGIVLFKQADGQSKMIDNAMVSKTKVYLKDAAGNYIMENGSKKAFELQDSGAFSATGLALGDYTLEISYEVAPGQELVISRGNVSVKANGEMNISEELVDPYGTVTDAATNATIEGAKVTLYYADTQRNKDNGRTPYAGVVLPAIADFEPNNNASPVQLTNNGGLYAYMVFPHADYYLVVTKDGYQAYTSPTIPVETDIVKHDIKMNRVKKSSGGGSSSTPASDPAVSLNISTDKNLVKEGDNSTLNIDYKNGSANTLPSGEIKVTLPDGITIVDAAGGKVNGNVITWSVTDLGGGQSGSRTVIIKWPQIDAQGKSFNVSGEFVAGNNAAAPVQAQSEVKVQVFSDRFGELSHQRYILGYPDGMFKPAGSSPALS